MFWKRKVKEPNWQSRAEVGRWGEEVAARYLEEKGYKIIVRHWTHRIGEIDIITAKQGRIIFVEVRAKTSFRYGRPEESVGWHKQARLRRAANVYMIENKLNNVPYQIDFIAVLYNAASQRADLRHLENVIEGR